MKIKNLGSLLPDSKELKYMRQQFVEAACLQGRIALFYEIAHINYSSIDPEVEYREPKKVPYTLDETPSVSLLSKYGWFSEDTEKVPLIANMTFHDLNNKPIKIEEQCILELTSVVDTDGTTIAKKFMVNAVSSDLERNMAVLSLTPYRECITPLDNISIEPQDKYLKREEQWSRRIEG